MKLKIFLAILAQTAAASAQNVVVTFQPAALPGGVIVVSEWVEEGVRLSTPSGVASNDASNTLFPHDGGAYLQTLSGWSPLTITAAGPQPFTLFSVDLAEYSTLFSGPKSITFSGVQFGGGMVSVTFVTDGIIDGNGPLADFETFFFPTTFTNLTQVTVATDTFALDNLNIVVPEPAAFSLLVFGLLLCAIAGRRFRRRRRSAAAG